MMQNNKHANFGFTHSAACGVAGLAASLLIMLAAAFAPGAAFADDKAALTQEERKMQAYAARQFNRGQMAAARGNPKEAKTHFVESIKTYEKYFGEYDERLIDPIAGYAQTYAGIWQEPNKKQRALLERLLDLYDHLGKTGQERAIVMAQLGDWWVTSENEKKSTDYYQKAWNAVAEEHGAEDANRQYNKARTLYFKPPVYRPRKPGNEGGKVVVNYSIAPSGRVVDLKILESDVRPEVSGGLNKALRKRRYRPFLLDGVPQAVTNLTLSFTYPDEGGPPTEAAVLPEAP